jgi:hypothetical protein
MSFYFIVLGIRIIVIAIIKEVGKSKRISQFKKMDSSKIESIGNYEKKSKSKYSILSFWNKKIHEP